MTFLAWILSLALILFGASGILFMGAFPDEVHDKEGRQVLAWFLLAFGAGLNFYIVF